MRLVAGLLGVLLAAQPPDLRQIVRADVAQHQKAIVDELLQLLAIPNVAADKPNIRRNAAHLQRLLTRHGFTSEILETDGNPLVYASADFGRAQSVLVSGHFGG